LPALNERRAPATIDTPFTIAARIVASSVARVASNTRPVAMGNAAHHTNNNWVSVNCSTAFRVNVSFWVYSIRVPFQRFVFRVPCDTPWLWLTVRNDAPNVSGVTVRANANAVSMSVTVTTVGAIARVVDFGARFAMRPFAFVAVAVAVFRFAMSFVRFVCASRYCDLSLHIEMTSRVKCC
jgi:hypothetical protein